MFNLPFQTYKIKETNRLTVYPFIVKNNIKMYYGSAICRKGEQTSFIRVEYHLFGTKAYACPSAVFQKRCLICESKERYKEGLWHHLKTKCSLFSLVEDIDDPGYFQILQIGNKDKFIDNLLKISFQDILFSPDTELVFSSDFNKIKIIPREIPRNEALASSTIPLDDYLNCPTMNEQQKLLKSKEL